MALTLEKAERIIAGAFRKANELGIAISVAVVDANGHLVALRRMDGCRQISPEMALRKAFTAAAFQRDTEALRQVPFFASGPVVAGKMIVALPGGLPIREGEQVIGGVGAGGGTGEQDAECARAGLDYLRAAG